MAMKLQPNRQSANALADLDNMSRAERRAKAEQPPAPTEAPPVWGGATLTGLGLAPVPGSQTKWFAFRCSTDGAVQVLTPLYDGKLKGEGKPAATGRLKLALMKTLGGVE